MGFGQGLSGLNAAAQTLDVIGNNISNSGTVGFKSGTATFADVYASSRVGLGTKVSGINQRFTVGNLSSTGNQFDIAIDGAKGLFRLEDTSGAVLYSRNGQFFPNKDGFLVNAQGHKLTGYPMKAETGMLGTAPEPLTVPTGNIAPRATGKHPDPALQGITAKLNLDASEKPGTGFALLPFVPPATEDTVPNPKTYNHTLRMTVYDSLGRDHQLTQYFVKKNDDKTWEVHYQLNDEKPLGASHNLEFTSGGVFPTDALTGLPDPLIETTSVTFSVSPAANLVIPISYANSTQFDGEFASTYNQDGYPTGDYASMSIASDGSIFASYTNGETQDMGKLVLADFANLQGLQPVGGNAWAQSSTSGAPILGIPGANGLATVMGQAVEESNVDMSQELVNMIIAQRTYQANAQTIKTQDQVMQTLINMR